MANTTTQTDFGSDTLTEGIRITVRPQFMPKESGAQFVFAYQITIRNESETTVHLRTRHWIIVDADGQRHDVHGEGVVGHTPSLGPGEHFEYASYCPLPTPWGTMEGEYEFTRDDGEAFRARIGRFYLVAPAASSDDEIE